MILLIPKNTSGRHQWFLRQLLTDRDLSAWIIAGLTKSPSDTQTRSQE